MVSLAFIRKMENMVHLLCKLMLGPHLPDTARLVQPDKFLGDQGITAASSVNFGVLFWRQPKDLQDPEVINFLFDEVWDFIITNCIMSDAEIYRRVNLL